MPSWKVIICPEGHCKMCSGLFVRMGGLGEGREMLQQVHACMIHCKGHHPRPCTVIFDRTMIKAMELDF